MVSLIEARSRTQAANSINASRPIHQHLSESHPLVLERAQAIFEDLMKDLHKTGILPQEFSSQHFSTVRDQYLQAFDTAAKRIATKLGDSASALSNGFEATAGSDLFERSRALAGAGSGSWSPSTIELSRSIAFQNSDIFDRSNAIIPFHLGRSLLGQTFSMDSNPQVQDEASQRVMHVAELMLGNREGPSIYASSYEEKEKIGSGAFGSVYRARHIIDGQDYAIKTVVCYLITTQLQTSMRQH
jgi:hypothetical protein